MLKVKKPEFSGLFYNQNKYLLNYKLQKYLQVSAKFNQQIRALIVPHAGYIYSGQCAAHAYALVKKQQTLYKNIYILAPSHNYDFNMPRSCDYNFFTTPIGALKVNNLEIERLKAENHLHIDNQVFVKEHSIEVQLPFIVKIFGLKVNIILCLLSRTKVAYITNIIDHIFQNKDNFLVISADLSHFLNIQMQQARDLNTIAKIENLDPNFITYEESCNAMAINGLMNFCSNNNYNIKNVYFANSAEKTKDYNKVVGYGSFVIY